jgi:hypothetical protein
MTARGNWYRDDAFLRMTGNIDGEGGRRVETLAVEKVTGDGVG